MFDRRVLSVYIRYRRPAVQDSSMSTRKLHPKERYFRYLSRLSRGGRSNMYGAVPYLAAAFGLDREAAFRVVCEWVDAQQAAQAAAAPAMPATKPAPVGAPAPVQPPPPVASSRARGKPGSTRRKAAGVTRKPVGVKRKRPGVRRAA
jgi:hypothetical protein